MKFGVGQSAGRTKDEESHWRSVLQSWCECWCWVADCFLRSYVHELNSYGYRVAETSRASFVAMVVSDLKTEADDAVELVLASFDPCEP